MTVMPPPSPGQPPAVSVIVPVYNAQATIAATIASALAQSSPGFELIAIDDGSTDGSLQCLLAMAKTDARVRVVSQANAGPSAARNLGAELAQAPLLAFLDADDLWHADKLADHLALHARTPGACASYARIAFIDSAATTIEGARTHSSLARAEPQLSDVLGENPVCTMSNLVVRRQDFLACGGCDASLAHAEDQDLLARLLIQGGALLGIDAVRVGYRFSPDGLSADLDRMMAGWREVAQRYLDEGTHAPLEALYYRYLARRVLRSGGAPAAARRYVEAGLRRDCATFLTDPRRSLPTIGAVMVAPLIPAPLRRRLFA